MFKREKLWLFLGIIFVFFFVVSVFIAGMEYGLKEETYISSTNESYTQNIEACREAVNKANEGKTEEEKTAAVKTSCITEINDNSREAKILSDRGYGDLLKTE